MKKSFLTFLAIVALCLNMNAQKGKKGKKTRDRTPPQAEQQSQRAQAPQSFNPRADRQIAIVSDSGLKSMTGAGISASYYATPNIAIDAGAGIGIFVLKAGVRGRYLFLDKKFSPYVGAGLFRNTSSVDGFLFPSADGLVEYRVDIQPSIFAQGIVGFEYMSDRGFVVGLHIGYSGNFNDTPWTSDEIIDFDTVTILDLFYGSGFATGLRIGYAF